MKIITLFDDELNDAIDDILREDEEMQDRIKKADSEKEYIDSIDNAEELIKLMRKGVDVINERWVCKKALEMQDEFMPLMLKYFERNKQDHFVEMCSCIFGHADDEYAERLYEIYPNIKNPYAQALACLIFGIKYMQDKAEFLLEEYLKMKNLYGDESFVQCTLLALHLLNDIV